MSTARHLVIGIWMLSALLVLAGTVTAQSSSSGLWAPTVCISPAVFLFAAVLPVETIVSWAESVLLGAGGG